MRRFFLLLFLHVRQIYKCKNKMIINNREMYFKHCSTLIYELVTIHLGTVDSRYLEIEGTL